MASIGQGYTVARFADLLERCGITDVPRRDRRRGRGARAEARRRGVARRHREPERDAAAGPALRMPPAARTAVITSGTYRHYFEADGRRYRPHHRSAHGRPVEHALVAVTVAATGRDAAAAWGTALLCLGPDAGFAPRPNARASLPCLGAT